MKLPSRTASLLLSLGSLMTIAAIIWWWITYGEVVMYGYLSWREAGSCLVQSSDICSLAKALCLGSHPRILVAYWASAFWLGAIILSSSFLVPDRTRTA
jgi:hypothetical protein